MFKMLKKHWFITGLCLAVGLGILFPQLAVLNQGNWISTMLVTVIFLGMGFTLPSEAISNGIRKWKIHLFLQGFIFILTPALFIITTYFLRPYLSDSIYIGLLALAVLPTTISTCAVLTQTSGGDSVLTMFNASLSNVLGIFISPLLLSFLLHEAEQSMPMSVLLDIIYGLSLKMVLPLIVGQIMRYFWKQHALTHKKNIGTASNVCILCIVLLTLAKSASTPELDMSILSLILPVIYLICIHCLLLSLALGMSLLFRFSGTEIISVLFTAPQKTLALGVPLLSAYFINQPALLGIAILPLLFYHPWQLFIAGVIKSLPPFTRLAENEIQ